MKVHHVGDSPLYSVPASAPAGDTAVVPLATAQAIAVPAAGARVWHRPTDITPGLPLEVGEQPDAAKPSFVRARPMAPLPATPRLSPAAFVQARLAPAPQTPGEMPGQMPGQTHAVPPAPAPVESEAIRPAGEPAAAPDAVGVARSPTEMHATSVKLAEIRTDKLERDLVVLRRELSRLQTEKRSSDLELLEARRAARAVEEKIDKVKSTISFQLGSALVEFEPVAACRLATAKAALLRVSQFPPLAGAARAHAAGHHGQPRPVGRGGAFDGVGSGDGFDPRQ